MRICETDIINIIISNYNIDRKSLSAIRYYRPGTVQELFMDLQLQLVPNVYKDDPVDEPEFFNITEGGFFVISIDKGETLSEEYVRDYRLYYTDLIKKIRDNKLNELGIN